MPIRVALIAEAVEDLTGYRTIVVGDRDWRIVFRMSDDGQTVVVVVIGDRDDAACYEFASRRMERHQGPLPADFSLAEAMLQLMQTGKRLRRG